MVLVLCTNFFDPCNILKSKGILIVISTYIISIFFNFNKKVKKKNVLIVKVTYNITYYLYLKYIYITKVRPL